MVALGDSTVLIFVGEMTDTFQGVSPLQRHPSRFVPQALSSAHICDDFRWRSEQHDRGWGLRTRACAASGGHIFIHILFFKTLKDHTHILFLPPVNSFMASASASIDSMSKLLVGSSWRKNIKLFSLTQSHWTLFTSSERLCFCKVSQLGFLETAHLN